jgi:hypothetical protein
MIYVNAFVNASKFAAATIALAIALPGTAYAQTSTIKLLDYHTSAPTSWTVRPPSSSSRLAQFIVPGADSATSAEIVVYSFGSTPGGNVEANLARWRGQFSTPNGSPAPEKITRDSSGAFPITIAEFRGTYKRGIGAGSADSVRTGQALISAIVETPKGALFMQLFGPAARVIAERDAFVRFVRDLK